MIKNPGCRAQITAEADALFTNGDLTAAELDPSATDFAELRIARRARLLHLVGRGILSSHHLVQMWLHGVAKGEQDVGHPLPRGFQICLWTCQAARRVSFQQDCGRPVSMAIVTPHDGPFHFPSDLLPVPEQGTELFLVAGPSETQERLGPSPG